MSRKAIAPPGIRCVSPLRSPAISTPIWRRAGRVFMRCTTPTFFMIPTGFRSGKGVCEAAAADGDPEGRGIGNLAGLVHLRRIEYRLAARARKSPLRPDGARGDPGGRRSVRGPPFLVFVIREGETGHAFGDGGFCVRLVRADPGAGRELPPSRNFSADPVEKMFRRYYIIT